MTLQPLSRPIDHLKLGVFLRVVFLLTASLRLAQAEINPSTNTLPTPIVYEYKTASFDGVGKWFLGREIAHFMSHQGAPWLEREERDTEEQPSRLIAALNLKLGQQVGDVGAGSGYMSWRLAKAVGPSGRVYANDIQPEMIEILKTTVLNRGLSTVLPVLGTVTNVNLPKAALDLILLVDVYHECDHPFEMVRSMVDSLKPNGRLVLVEYRGEDRWVPIKPLHKMTEEQVRREFSLHPLHFVTNLTVLPRQHILIFSKDKTEAQTPKLKK